MSEYEPYDYILDAWALLAHFGNEDGGKRVKEVLKLAEQKEASIGLSLINLGEIAYITERERGLILVHATLSHIYSLPLSILPVDEHVVLTAAHLKANYRLSYADAIAAATAKLRNAKLLTGDPELKALDGKEIKVEWLL